MAKRKGNAAGITGHIAEATAAEQLAWRIKWNREAHGVDQEGVMDRAKEVAKMVKPPRFSPTK